MCKNCSTEITLVYELREKCCTNSSRDRISSVYYYGVGSLANIVFVSDNVLEDREICVNLSPFVYFGHSNTKRSSSMTPKISERQ